MQLTCDYFMAKQMQKSKQALKHLKARSRQAGTQLETEGSCGCARRRLKSKAAVRFSYNGCG